MCFSAPMSFAASALLLPAGFYALRLAYQQNTRYIPLASIPVAFAIQQACEGLVWLGLGTDSLIEMNLGAFGFLAFAYWFWLFWSPCSVALLEANPNVRSLCWGFGILGFIYGGLLYVPMLIQPQWLSVHVVHHSIQYDTRLIFDPWFSQQFDRLLYALIILIPFSLASNRSLKLFGAAIAVSAIVTHLLLYQVFVSVWCFFAAILSLWLVFICQSAPIADLENAEC
jgi:hypothetical protein